MYFGFFLVLVPWPCLCFGLAFVLCTFRFCPLYFGFFLVLVPWPCLCFGLACALALLVLWPCLCFGLACALALLVPWPCLCFGLACALALLVPWPCLCLGLGGGWLLGAAPWKIRRRSGPERTADAIQEPKSTSRCKFGRNPGFDQLSRRLCP